MKRILALVLVLVMALPTALCFAEENAPSVTGKVTEIEKYGHAVLDVTIEAFNGAGFALGDIVTVTAGTFTGDIPYFDGYYVNKGEYMVRAYPGHTCIAVCINVIQAECEAFGQLLCATVINDMLCDIDSNGRCAIGRINVSKRCSYIPTGICLCDACGFRTGCCYACDLELTVHVGIAYYNCE